MKHAQVRQRRHDQNGQRQLNIVCPICDRRHWIPDAAVGRCPRRPGMFAIGGRDR